MAFLLTFIILSYPIYFILSTPVWRNPFFLIPFVIPLVILLTSSDYTTFLTRFLSFSSCVLFYFSCTRTRFPYILIEVILVNTGYFRGFPEANLFQRFMRYAFFIPFPFIAGLLAYHLVRVS